MPDGSNRREGIDRPLIILVLVSILAPLALVAFLIASSASQLNQLIDERNQSNLDILQEHALKVLQTTERLLYESKELIGPPPFAYSADDEARVSAKLSEIQRAIPEVEAIWAFGRDGHPLVSSTVQPVPRTINNSDRDYFKAQASHNAGTYIGRPIKARVGNEVFFVASQRLHASDGDFSGVVALTLPPKGLESFYQKLASGSPYSLGLFRQDGSALARFPAPPSGLASAQTSDAFLRQLADSPDQGVYRATSGVDNVARRIAYRKLQGYELYVTSAYDQTYFLRDLWNALARTLSFGLFVMVLLIAATWMAVQRTRHYLVESGLRNKAEDALSHVQRLEALGRLTGGVAHDFNNLLMVVQGSSDRLANSNLDAKQRRAVSMISQATDHGVKLTRQLLSFSRTQPVKAEIINLAEHLNQVKELITGSLKGNISFSMQANGQLWPIEADAAEFDLAMLNLAINAQDAMPNGGTLTIKANNDEGSSTVRITITDSGTGIAPEHLPSIFDPFFTTKPVGKGTGLGLSQVYGSVKRAGGTIQVQSELSKGTVFALHFPKAELPQSLTRPASASKGEDRPELNILFVEDNELVAEATKSNLVQLGHQVTHLVKADDALSLLAEIKSFDVVVTDIVMPGKLDGIGLINLIRQRKDAKDVPIIVTSGYSEETQSILDLGLPLLPKPYSLVQLEAALLKACSSKDRSPRSAAPATKA